MKNFNETKLSHLTKGLICNYHYGFNIEYAKLVFEKGPIVNNLMGDISTVSKQVGLMKVCPAGFLLHVSKSNLNDLEIALKKFKASIEVYI